VSLASELSLDSAVAVDASWQHLTSARVAAELVVGRFLGRRLVLSPEASFRARSATPHLPAAQDLRFSIGGGLQ
jgi:hypothetical protein